MGVSESVCEWVCVSAWVSEWVHVCEWVCVYVSECEIAWMWVVVWLRECEWLSVSMWVKVQDKRFKVVLEPLTCAALCAPFSCMKASLEKSFTPWFRHRINYKIVTRSWIQCVVFCIWMLNPHPPVSFQFVCVEVSVRSSESCWSGSGEELILFLLHNSLVRLFFQTMVYISGICSLVSEFGCRALMLMLFVPFHKLTKHFCVRCYKIWSFRAFSVWNQKFVCDDDSCDSLSKNPDWKK